MRRVLIAPFILLALSACGSSSGTTVSKLALTPTGQKLAVGATLQMTVTATFENGTTTDLTSRADYGSDSPSFANFLGATPGLLTGIATGTATVYAIADGITATATVTIPAPTGNLDGGSGATLKSVAVTPTGDQVAVGAQISLTATARYSDGSSQDVSTVAAWTVNHTNLATVDTQGDVTGAAVGTVIVSATYNGLSGSVEVMVTTAPPAITSISISPEPSMLGVGQQVQLTATATYANGTTGNVTGSVNWSSSMDSIATVTGGLLDGVALGMATISATIGLDEEQFNVTVVTHPVDAG